MNKINDWGIDLTNRKMKYQPWTIDIEGKYIAPSEEEKDKIYGISGDAVRETLIYFEECSGDTDELIRLLNEHIIDNRFFIDRESLLDNKRWYNNEYYFYFQIFCKKIIGRYNWHFGECSNEQLSVYHKIWEKGKFGFVPFGGEHKHINHAIISGFIDYYRANGVDFTDYFNWIKILSKELTNLDYKIDLFKIRDFFLK